ncbi:3'-5' exonuclease [Tulasnella sp. JGI-2019a]|nr:3'-5' exonuclease [Tulasnella sp. JGI-2019a]KAG8997139.1 3'-5' exonuclease [Tulasnella sp. JGI-2019a]
MSHSKQSKLTKGEHATSSSEIEHLRKMVQGQLRYTENQRQPGKYLAIDCEMVGTGPKGKQDSLARISVVNYYGAVLLDTFVSQDSEVTDYRTKSSGVRLKDVEGPDAKKLADTKKLVKTLLKDNPVLIGHTLCKDLQVLGVSHPAHLRHDVWENSAWKSKFPDVKSPGLKMLVQSELGIVIQNGEHDSVMDARAAMALFRLSEKAPKSGVSTPKPKSAGNSQVVLKSTGKSQLHAARPDPVPPTAPGKRGGASKAPAMTPAKGTSFSAGTSTSSVARDKGTSKSAQTTPEKHKGGTQANSASSKGASKRSKTPPVSNVKIQQPVRQDTKQKSGSPKSEGSWFAFKGARRYGTGWIFDP